MSTFGQLKTDVDNWLARDDIAVSGASIGSIMLLAESELSRDIRCVIQEQRVDLVTVGSAREVDLPADFLQMRQGFIDTTNGRFFEYQTPEVIREQSTWQGSSPVSFYTIEGGDDLTGTVSARIVLTPAPDASNPTTLDVLYWARFAALTADPDTNWLMQNHYDVYLWQTLKQAAIFDQDDELEMKYDGRYQAARNDMRLHENRKRFRGNQWQSYGTPRAII